jgi:hypothetical protein
MIHNAKSRVCHSINQVYNQGKNLGSLNGKGFGSMKELKYVQKFFKINQQEALILSAFAFKKICGDESLCLKDIIEWLNIPGIDLVPEIYSSITNLIKSDLIAREMSRWERKEGHYILTEAAYKAILTGDEKYLENKEVENFHHLLGKIMNLYNDFRFDFMNGEDFQIKVHNLLEKAFEMPEMQWISKFDLDVNEKQLVIIMAANHLHFPNKSVDVERILQRIDRKYYLIAKDIMIGKNILMKENLITFATNQFKTLDEMKLSDMTCDHFGLNKADEGKPTNLEYGQLIFPEDIEYKTVFYNKEVEKQMNFLKKIIDVYQNDKGEEKIFRSVKLMINGPSGTGKTQTILNLAKESEAIIYEVGHHQLKQPYVGMSEAAYHGTFIEYYRCCDHYKKLGKQVWFVINEFEGLVSRRFTANHSADFMVSTITSIFLKETDSSVFRGVILCTCNHIDQVDHSVLRRMTHKINMNEPDVETRIKIFENRFPFLCTSDIKSICTHFPLSGANIENILEKYVLLEKIDALENKKSFQNIWEMCEQELSLNPETRKPIGFNH